MENAKKFFEEAIRTEEAKALFASFEKPETEEETLKIYAEVAAKLGIELSVEEIRAYLEGKKSSGEISDEELSQLTGGAGDHPECDSTYRDKENCWWHDGCDIFFNNLYPDYICKRVNE